MMDKLTLTDEVYVVFKRWLEVDTSVASHANFQDYIGIKTYDMLNHPAWTMLVSPLGFERIQLLLGPHYRAIIKTYLARRNW